MSHRKKNALHHEHGHGHTQSTAAKETKRPAAKLDLVIKAESSGSLEAVLSAISAIHPHNAPINIIHQGIGAVNKTDILNAETGSRLVIGFEVKVLPHVQETCRENNVEVRLYTVIYRLTEELRKIAESLVPTEQEETITAAAKVISLFKSSRHGIILGCEVTGGRIRLGDRFRVITAMGPLYTGRIESLHIDQDTVTEAKPGQQVGIKIRDLHQGHIGDLVECFVQKKSRLRPWQPSGQIVNG